MLLKTGFRFCKTKEIIYQHFKNVSQLGFSKKKYILL